MKNMKKPWISTILISTLAMFALASVAFAEYASTEVYFNVPTTTTFTIRMPSSYSGAEAVAISGANEGAATPTPWISFNGSTPFPDAIWWIEPYTEGASGSQQIGTGTPIFWIEHTGNVNMDLWMYWNESLPTGWKVHANGTCDGACIGTAVNKVNITATAEDGAHLLVDEFNSGDYVNITLYGNVTTAGVSGPMKLYTKSNSTA